MSFQPIKFRTDQYQYIKNVIGREFGNVSIPKGLYIIMYVYLKHIPRNIREYYRKRYYVSDKRRSNIRWK